MKSRGNEAISLNYLISNNLFWRYNHRHCSTISADFLNETLWLPFMSQRTFDYFPWEICVENTSTGASTQSHSINFLVQQHCLDTFRWTINYFIQTNSSKFTLRRYAHKLKLIYTKTFLSICQRLDYWLFSGLFGFLFWSYFVLISVVCIKL